MFASDNKIKATLDQQRNHSDRLSSGGLWSAWPEGTARTCGGARTHEDGGTEG